MLLRNRSFSVLDQAWLRILGGFGRTPVRIGRALIRRVDNWLQKRNVPTVGNKKTDKAGYNEYYKKQSGALSFLGDADEYIQRFESHNISPYCKGGHTKGYVRGLAVRALLKAADQLGLRRKAITVLDAGCGTGRLSVYLACKGFSVIGVDISEEGCCTAQCLATQLGVSQRCTFLVESLEKISVPDSSIDFIIGHGALHHFIKYEGVPVEFKRIMKMNAQAFFADSFGENWIYHIFHDQRTMEKLGDVILTKKLITNYFSEFKVELMPTDWFVMLDKVYLRLLPKSFQGLARFLARIHFSLDRKIRSSNRFLLFLSGSVMTSITKTRQSSSLSQCE